MRCAHHVKITFVNYTLTTTEAAPNIAQRKCLECSLWCGWPSYIHQCTNYKCKIL